MGGLVYSTDPNFCPNSPTDDTIETLPPEKQRLHLRYERSGRGGKEVTLVTGFVGNSGDLKALATKASCRMRGLCQRWRDYTTGR